MVGTGTGITMKALVQRIKISTGTKNRCFEPVFKKNYFPKLFLAGKLVHTYALEQTH